jgi:phosphatidylinositol glycan class C protein
VSIFFRPYAAPLRWVTGPMQRPSRRLPRWEKVLYCKQPYEDNFVDDARFLEQMRRNPDVTVFDYGDLVRESAAVSQHLSMVVIFIVIFKHLWDHNLSLPFILSLDSFLFVLWMLCLPMFDAEFALENVATTASSVTLFIVLLLLLSPVMHSLTYTYSNDTIWAMAIFFMFLNMCSTDYRYVSGAAKRHTGVLAVNAATFASVLLASRLPSALHAFSILALAMMLFGLYPVLQRHLKKWSVQWFLATTCVLVTIAAVSLFYVIKVLAVLFGIAIVLISFVFPKALISAQKAWKLQIKGPWDEAQPPLAESSLQYQS